MIQHILVVGAGAMGSQIALVCATTGYHATLYDIDAGRLPVAEAELRDLLTTRVAKGRMGADDADAALRRLSYTTDLDSATRDTDFVIEAAVEKLDVKRNLFQHLDRLAGAHTILATNSSSFVPSQLADATGRPDRVCNLHFFNPATVMRCVEVVRGPQTSEATIATTVELARALGKTPVVLDREIPGFIANRILNAVRDEAIHLLENDIASVEAIDTACRTALGYPMGPFELMDLTGIDIGYFTKSARFAESGDPRDAPSASVTALVERGELGRKTGLGWYVYAPDGTKSPRPRPDISAKEPTWT
ncbi:3-hydroxyacyl-CoA dehydrogenase family protein [Mycobacterium sp. NAZ190054]|uniref:3-hydroxyacyl-CoA dehydrogenase family protein n=1 Tax=Mycobacterium sp. NAZ190054 TaxID=1747766 RepID=UPI0007967F60|nr:3-hydroxyacyl-CoA dehydrogenase family protein [Mycobacterium sp. NAZ190054]KWX56505.1 3-hydroxyacyl-CoA dehydrogenase [Mycobacterium sp. NAZ190054]